MRPNNYSKIASNKIIFHYTFSQLRNFLTHGFKEGNNGFILIGQEKDFYIYKGFGTIENPCKELRQISMQHDPIFDGKMVSPKELITKKKNKSLTSYRIKILDLSKNTN